MDMIEQGAKGSREHRGGCRIREHRAEGRNQQSRYFTISGVINVMPLL
jgi:hypothetical protein